MSLPITFKFDGSAAVGLLLSVKRTMRAPNAPALKRGFEDAGTAYLQFLRRRFQRFSAGGGDWPKLKPETVRRKGGNTKILRDTDRLFHSLYRGSPDCIFVVDAKGLTFGTMVPYYRFHHRRRRVYVQPDPGTRALMKSKLDTAVYAAVREAVASVRSFSPKPAA